MKGERSGVVGPAFSSGARQNSTRLLYRGYIEILKAEVGPAGQEAALLRERPGPSQGLARPFAPGANPSASYNLLVLR